MKRRLLPVLLLVQLLLTGAAPASLPWRAFDQGLEAAAKSDRLLLVQIYADWRHECHKMEQDMLSQAPLQRLILEHYVPARVNLQSQRQLRYQGQLLSEEQSRYGVELSYAKAVSPSARFELSASYSPYEYVLGAPTSYSVRHDNGGSNKVEFEALWAVAF